jgi:hypothetical protein
MAKIQQETLTLKLSKLVRDSDSEESILTQDLIEQVEQIVQELVGKDVIVEG